jgi:hypothetical protein
MAVDLLESDCAGCDYTSATLRPFVPTSWFHPDGVFKVRKKLLPRIPDVSGMLFLTFTVDPKLYSGPESAFKHASDRIRRVFFRLRKGVTWEGKEYRISEPYLRKLEFHENGYAHFHVIFLTRRFLPGELVNHLWGIGRTNVKRISNKDFDYLLKYVSKGNSLPDWVKDQSRMRVVQPSRGFYLKLDQLGEVDDDTSGTGKEPVKRKQYTIGERIERWKHMGTFKVGEKTRSVQMPRHFSEIISEEILSIAEAGRYLGNRTIKIQTRKDLAPWLMTKNERILVGLMKAGFLPEESWSHQPQNWSTRRTEANWSSSPTKSHSSQV